MRTVTHPLFLYDSAPCGPHPVAIPLRLDTHRTLPDGLRLRLRLPQARDRVDVLELLARRADMAADELDVVRALRFDPKTHTVVCATAWTGTAETMVGIVARAKDGAVPDLLIADEALAPGVGAVLLGLFDGAASGRRAA
ncbi:MAG: hypothetical protein JWO02_922 [Solirubrobacterales bacterium]|nr:hypothetical protein [Solirubrobacterales bacterium]